MTASTRRIPEEAGWAGKLPTGPNGLPLCRKCGSECPTRRNTFCSAACVHEWKLRTQPAYQARHVLKRDAGVCELCARDCVALLEELRVLRKSARLQRFPGMSEWTAESSLANSLNGEAYVARCDELGLPLSFRSLTRRLWEMDHRVPVAEGGGSCGIDNLRTLCWSCHRRVTAELRARLAERRRQQKARSA